MSLDAMKQTLDALEHEARTGNDDAYRVERDALRAAIEQAQEPEQELVCVCGAIWEGQELVSTPLPRQWQGLTDEERGITAAETWGSALIAPQSYQAFARAIEAKLRERNA